MVAVVTCAVSAFAQAAQPNRLRVGHFSWDAAAPFDPSSGPRISFDIVGWRDGHAVNRGGRQVVADLYVGCTSSPASPSGIPANHPIVLRLHRMNLEIVGHRSFSYSGPATIYPIGNYAATAPTQLVVHARFAGVARTRTATYPTGFSGSFSSSACARSTITFAYHQL